MTSETFNLTGTLTDVRFDAGTLSAPAAATIVFTEANDEATVWSLNALNKGARAAERLHGQDVRATVQEVAEGKFRLLSAVEVVL